MSDPIHPDFFIRLRALADSAPPEIRLRALLKTALRRDRLKCVSVSLEQLPPLPTPPSEDVAHDAD